MTMNLGPFTFNHSYKTWSDATNQPRTQTSQGLDMKDQPRTQTSQGLDMKDWSSQTPQVFFYTQKNQNIIILII
jgi:hypothetical protein